MVSSSSTLRRLACAFLCLGSSLAWSQSQPVFPVLHYDPYAVASPLAMADGDVNGDGVTDTVYAAASTSSGSSTLTSAPRDGSGATLSSIVAGIVPCTPNSLLLADLNKDNRLDAIVTCAEDKLAVLAGNGDGTFQSATIFDLTKAATAAVADLNDDGYPEIIVATNTGTSDSVFAILLNTSGSGSLALAAPHLYAGMFNGNPWVKGSDQLVVGDLNNDGKLDIVTGGNPDAAVQGTPAAVFYGNGDGTAQSASALQFANNNIALGDFNSDGQVDIARLYSRSLTTFDAVMIETRQPTTMPNTTINFPVLTGIARIHAIDVNGDNRPDLVLTGRVTTILLNDGTAHLRFTGSYATPGAFYVARKGSRGTDLVFSTPRGFYTLHGDGQGSFDGLPAFLPSDRFALSDLNRDGITDLVSPTNFYGTFTAIGRGDGTFAKAAVVTPGLKPFAVLGDFNRDGNIDCAGIYSSGGSGSDATNSNQSRLLWSRGNGDGTFSLPGPSISLGWQVKNANAAVAGDFDGDGKLDLAVSYLDMDSTPKVAGIVLVHGNGDGTFAPPSAPFYSTGSTTSASLFATDLDNDGDLDLIWQNTAFLNSGNATFTPTPLSAATGTALQVGNLDGDSIPDVVVGNEIYSGNGDGTFQPAPFAAITIPSSATVISASIGDLNGDGHPDLILQHMTDMAGFTVAYGDGSGNFAIDSNLYTTGSTTPVTATFARLNNQATGHVEKPDYLIGSDGAVISLLNQNNARPGAPILLPTAIRLLTTPANPVPLQPVYFEAQMTGNSPTGTITFRTTDGTLIGSGVINNDVPLQQAQLSIPGAFSYPGTYNVVAHYLGDGINAPADSAPMTLTVAKRASTIAFLNTTPITVFTGYKANIQLDLEAYSPTGAVTLSSGDQVLGTAPASSGRFGFLQRFTAPGTYSLTATFPGDASNLPSTSPPTPSL